MKVQTDVKAGGGLLDLDIDVDVDIDIDLFCGKCGKETSQGPQVLVSLGYRPSTVEPRHEAGCPREHSARARPRGREGERCFVLCLRPAWGCGPGAGRLPSATLHQVPVIFLSFIDKAL